MDATEITTGSAPALPTLDPGVTLLTTDGRATGALQSLVLDRVLCGDGAALWVDADGHAATTSLAAVAPSRRTLERIRVARAFTAFQHHALLADLEAAAASLDAPVEVVVAPAVEHFYAADDLRRGEGEAMLTRGLELLGELAAARDVPVLLSRSGSGGERGRGPGGEAGSETGTEGETEAGAGLGAVVAAHSDAVLSCTRTGFGPRFVGEDAETLVYECRDGVQTTLAFWRRVLERRHAATLDAEPREVARVGAH